MMKINMNPTRTLKINKLVRVKVDSLKYPGFVIDKDLNLQE